MSVGVVAKTSHQKVTNGNGSTKKSASYRTRSGTRGIPPPLPSSAGPRCTRCTHPYVIDVGGDTLGADTLGHVAAGVSVAFSMLTGYPVLATHARSWGLTPYSVCLDPLYPLCRGSTPNAAWLYHIPLCFTLEEEERTSIQQCASVGVLSNSELAHPLGRGPAPAV